MNNPWKVITAAEWGCDWPLTVEAGVLELRPDGQILFHHRMRVYAVNGLAKQKKKWLGLHRRYCSINEIWADDLAHPGLKKNIGGLLRAGLALGAKP